ncbi:serine hydrolase domain-containing protein [Microbacterium sp. No. 7]|uniref:serine hydrolase domain-containing protein n=1 Tax=Microbacterium sp. No. 7 TaxID=1714373 RepID=UPI0006CF4871|nr:serine hydrolase domain-containing protein [Microbacterium sp. No. 7]ALJ20091.1 hypothetical protein AOA12_09280 [Microbacterium sp. No. 7]
MTRRTPSSAGASLRARRARSIAAAITAVLLVATPGLGATPAQAAATSAPATEGAWEGLMTGALARTATLPGAQAPAAWAIVEPDAGDDLVAATGGAGGAGADTPFLIGSLSKPVAAAALLRLVDAGAVRLDAAVHEYLPGFRAHDANPLTVTQLLSHTSGLSTEAGLDARKDPALTIAERAAGAEGVERVDAPSPGFAYSNLNYAIVGAIVERVSGRDYAAFVRDEVFSPLGMDDSSADPATAQEIARHGHLFAFGFPVGVQEIVPAGAAPDGYTVSTARDLAAFLRMLLRSGLADDGTRVLSDAAVHAMLRTRAAATETGAAAPGTDGYGLGWGTGGTVERPIAAHIGRTEGFFAHALLMPQSRRAVVVLQAANGRLYDQAATVHAAAAALAGEDAEGVGEPAAVTAAIFVAFGLVAVGAVPLVGLLRRRRDRRAPPRTRAEALRRRALRAVLDIGGAVLILVLWPLGAGMMLTGTPTLGTNPFSISIELTLVSWALAALLLVRGVLTATRPSRVPPSDAGAEDDHLPEDRRDAEEDDE